jgi:hypothetical protein
MADCTCRRNYWSPDVAYRVLIVRISSFNQILQKKPEYSWATHQLGKTWTNPVILLGGRFCIITPLSVRMNFLSLINKYSCDIFPAKNVLKKRRCFIIIAFKLCFRLCHYGVASTQRGTEIEWDTSAS